MKVTLGLFVRTPALLAAFLGHAFAAGILLPYPDLLNRGSLRAPGSYDGMHHRP